MITVSTVTSDTLADLVTLLRAIAAEELPDDPFAADTAEAGLVASRAASDFTRSDSFWILLASVDGEPAGYATICRIPKADERVGFLFVDELHVLRELRRRGVAQAGRGAGTAGAHRRTGAGVGTARRPLAGTARERTGPPFVSPGRV